MQQCCAFSRALVRGTALICLLATGGWARALPADAPANVPLNPDNLVYAVPTGTPVYYVAPSGSAANPGTFNAPWTVQKALATAPSGATIIFRGGTYRDVNNLDVNKRFTLQPYLNEPVWIKGSQIVTGWAQDGTAARWVKDAWTYEFPHEGSSEDIQASYPLAGNRDQVYIDNLPKTQVGSRGAVVAGTFFVDYTQDKLYVGDNPDGKTVEATILVNGLNLNNTTGTPTAADTIVRGLGWAHYADQAVQIFAQRVTFDNNTFAWNGLQGVRFRGGSNARVLNNGFSCNGRGGLGASRAHDLLLENNTISYNNVERFNDFSASGAKIIYTDRATCRWNVVERNYGIGLWLDLSCAPAKIVHNWVRHNEGIGIFFEISHDAIIAFNVCHNNSTGIHVSNSSRTRIYNNTLVANQRNLLIDDSSRNNTSNDEIAQGITWVSRNHVVKNNLLANPRSPNGFSLLQFYGVGDGEAASLMFDAINNNGYHHNSANVHLRCFVWSLDGGQGTNYATVALFRTATGWEPNGLEYNNTSASPFFLDEAGRDLRLRPNSVAINRGEALPADVAQAAGKPQSPVHLGALGTDAVSLYRLEAANGVQHFLTASQAENDFLISTGAWRSVGPVGFVHLSQRDMPELVPLFRLYAPSAGDHFYTINPAERDAAVQSGYYIYEGLAGWVWANGAPGRKPLYRAYNLATGQHLFTGSASLYNGLAAPWVREGVAAYVLEAP